MSKGLSIEDVQVVLSPAKRCLASLVVREQQIRTIRRHPHTPIRRLFFKNKEKCWQEREEIRTLVYC